MNLSVLRTFLAVGRKGDLNKAAAQLNVTESTVPAQPDALEDTLGKDLPPDPIATWRAVDQGRLRLSKPCRFDVPGVGSSVQGCRLAQRVFRPLQHFMTFRSFG